MNELSCIKAGVKSLLSYSFTARSASPSKVSVYFYRKGVGTIKAIEVRIRMVVEKDETGMEQNSFLPFVSLVSVSS